jgi:hypothetical protein
MKKKNHIQPSIEEAMQRIELYNKMCFAMRDLSHQEKQQVLLLLTVYMDLQERNQLVERRLSLVYAQCATFVFNYLYRAGQLKIDKVGFDPEIRKHINDVFITIAKGNDAD